MGKLGTILLVGLLFLGIAGVFMYISYNNKFVALENLYKKQISEDQLIHDEMWKILQSQAGVTENYAESFNKIYKNINDARYKTGGEMMKWIQEANPNFDSKLYDKVMTSIEVYRTKFTDVQTKLLSIHNEMENLLTLFPSSFFLSTIGGHVLPELKIVTSTKTEKAFETGKDDDIKLFKSDTVRH
jgi:hypothetical protein